MAVRNQQERESKMNFTLHEHSDIYVFDPWAGPTLQSQLVQKGIQHATIQTVMCFASWTRG
jgi:hypothetical protein